MIDHTLHQTFAYPTPTPRNEIKYSTRFRTRHSDMTPSFIFISERCSCASDSANCCTSSDSVGNSNPARSLPLCTRLLPLTCFAGNASPSEHNTGRRSRDPVHICTLEHVLCVQRHAGVKLGQEEPTGAASETRIRAPVNPLAAGSTAAEAQ